MMRHSLETLEARLLLSVRPVDPGLAVFGHEVEPNDSLDTATPMAQIALGMPCRAEPAQNNFVCPPDVFRGDGRLGAASVVNADLADVDYFSFPVAANARVSLHIEGPALQHGATFELVGPDGTVLARAESHDRNGDGTLDGAALEYSVQAAGDLYLRISSDQMVPEEGLEYHLGASIRVERNVEHEPNDTFDTANDIALNWHTSALTTSPVRLPGGPTEAFGFIRGELGNGSVSPDTDFFRFMTRASADVAVRVTGAGGQGGHLTVYDNEQKLVAEGDGDAEGNLTLSFESSSEGPYFAQLTDNGTVVCVTTPCLTYSIEIRERQQFVNPFAEQEPNDTLETANPMHEVPSPIRIMGDNAAGVAMDPDEVVTIACVDCGGLNRQSAFLARGDFSAGTESQADKDYFSFEADANRKLVIVIEGAGPTHVQLLDPTGSVLGEATTAAGQGQAGHAAIEFFTQPGGRFYILVEPSGAAAQPEVESHYSLRVTARAEPNAEHEPNDTIETANAIELHYGFGRCELVCPMANTPGGVAATDREANGSPDSAGSIPARLFDTRQTGYILGRADLTECPPEADCPFLFVPGVDFFSIDAEAERHLRVGLTGPLARLGGSISLFASDGTQLAHDDDLSDGLSIEWDTDEAGTFYVSVRVSDEGLTHIDNTTPCEPTAAGLCREATSYRLDVVSGRIANPIEGRDEQEPNDTIETANELELHTFPTLAPGIEVRGGDACGVAGGPTSDQDAYRFDVHAGEHVTVDVQGLVRDGQLPRPLETWLHDHHLNDFGDAPGTSYRDAAPRLGHKIDALGDRIEYILANHPEIDLGHFEVTVYDSSGNTVGTSQSGDQNAVTFDAAEDDTYYALVEAIDSTVVEPASHYRLGVLARSHYEEELVQPGDDTPGDEPGDEEPAVIVVGAGEAFHYTDENGDDVQVLLRGRTGKATITFSNSNPDGSDIVSIEIVGVRRGGSFTVQTDGSAEIGSLEIHGTTGVARRRGNSRPGNFGSVQVDGNVGMVQSDMNLRSLVVGGILGDLAARGRDIRELHAEMFDSAMADVGSIRTLDVDEDTATDSMFQNLLPWEPPAE